MNCSKGWAKRCSIAKGKRCTCACHGENHGVKKIKDTEQNNGEVFEYQGFHNFQSKCGLQIIEREGKALVILTELPDNPGTSITNAYEKIATALYHDRLSHISPDEICWIEHYPDRGRNFKGEPIFKDTYDRVFLKTRKDFNGHVRFEHPNWKPLNKEKDADVFRLLEIPSD